MERREKFSLRKSSKYKNLASVSLGVFFVTLGLGANESSAQASEVKDVQVSTPPAVQTNVPTAPVSTQASVPVVKVEQPVVENPVVEVAPPVKEAVIAESVVKDVAENSIATAVVTESPALGKEIKTTYQGNTFVLDTANDGGYGIRRLESVEAPNVIIPENVDNKKVEEIYAAAFKGKIESVSIPNSVKRIGYRAFSDAEIEKITIPEGVKELDISSLSTENLKKLEINGNLETHHDAKHYGSRVSGSLGVLNNRDKELPIEIVLKDTVTHIPVGLFANTKVITPQIPESVKFINDLAFYNTIFEKSIPKNEVARLIEEEEKISGTYQGNTLVIPGSVHQLDSFVFADVQGLDTVIFNSGLTTLNSYNFANSSVKEVYLPATLRYANSAFSEANNLKKVNFEEGLKMIPHWTLHRANSLEEVTIPRSIDEIGNGAFKNTNLKKIDLSKTNLRKLGTDVFYGTQIEELLLPETMTSLNLNSFNGMNNLKKLYIPRNVEEVTLGGYMNNVVFHVYKDSKAHKILAKSRYKYEIRPDSDYKPTGFEGIKREVKEKEFKTFAQSNPQIDQINQLIPKEREKIKIKDNLTHEYVGGEIKDGIIEIGASAFETANVGSDVTLPNTVRKLGEKSLSTSSMRKVKLPSSIEIGENAFVGAEKLQKAILEGDWKIIPAKLFNKSGLEYVVLPDTIKEIESEAFANSKLVGSLTSDEIEKEIKEGEAKLSNKLILPAELLLIRTNAFDNTYVSEIEMKGKVAQLEFKSLALKTLQSINLPSSLINVTEPFNGAENLTNVRFDGEWSKLHEGLFKGSGLTSMHNIPNTVYKIEEEAFMDTAKLKNIEIPESVWIIERNAFRNSALEEVTLHSNIRYAADPFYHASKLSKVNFVGEWKEIPSYMFRGSGLETIEIPKTVEIIGVEAFSETRLHSVKIPESVKAFNPNSFTKISALREIHLPKNIDVSSVKKTSLPEEVVYYVYKGSKAHQHMIANEIKHELVEESKNEFDKLLDESTAYILDKNKTSFVLNRGGTGYGYSTIDLKYKIADEVYTDKDEYWININTPKNMRFRELEGKFEYIDNADSLKIKLSSQLGELKLLYTELTGKDFSPLRAEIVQYKEDKSIKTRETLGVVNKNSLKLSYPEVINENTIKISGESIFPETEVKFFIDGYLSKKIVKTKKDGKFEVELQVASSKDVLLKEYYIEAFINEENRGVAKVTYKNDSLKIQNVQLKHNGYEFNSNQESNPVIVNREGEKYLITVLADKEVEKSEKELYIVAVTAEGYLINKKLKMNDIQKEIYEIDFTSKEFENIKSISVVHVESPTEEYIKKQLESIFKSPLISFAKKYFMDMPVQISKMQNMKVIGEKIPGLLDELSDGINKLGFKALSNINDLYTANKLVSVLYRILSNPIQFEEKVYKGTDVIGIEERKIYLLASGFSQLALLIAKQSPHPVVKLATTVLDELNKYSNKNVPTLDSIYLKVFSGTLQEIFPKIIIDPSGVVRNTITNQPIKDALAQIYYRDKDGKEVLWDAGEYSQINPLRTTVNGEYAWDVPAGFWKVKVSKDGYTSAESEWLEVAPPRTDVHFNLVPNTYKLNYNLNGGTFVGDLLSTYQTDVKKDLLNPERQGYKFAGWYDNANLTGNKVVDTLFSSLGDKTLWAKWIQDTVAPVINVITDKPKVAPTREMLPELDIALVIDKKEDSNTGGVITYVPEVTLTREVLPELDIALVIDKKEDSNTGGVTTYVPKVAPTREVLPEYDIAKLLEEIKSNQESTKPLGKPASNSGTKERKVNANNTVLPKTSSHSEDSELPLALASALLTVGLITSRRKNN